MKPPPLTMRWEYYFDARDYEFAAAAWTLGLLSPEDATWVAATALERGHDTQTIREVAGLFRPTRRDEGDKIDRMFSDVGVEGLSKEQALDCYSLCLILRLREAAEEDFDAVMSEVWKLYFRVIDENTGSAGKYWSRLCSTMWKWDEIYAIFGEFGYARSQRKLLRERAKLIGETSQWARDVIEGHR